MLALGGRWVFMASQFSAATDSGACTADVAKAAARRAGSDTLPSSRSRMMAARAGPVTAVSVKAACRSGVASTDARSGELRGQRRELLGIDLLEHFGGVSLERGVHGRAPEPLAVASASARSAATASSIRSRWAS